MESWYKNLPDYTFIKWDLTKFDLNTSIWVKQAFEAKKYAFAADYIRLYALSEYGGIYLDTDVEVLKSFDTLLHLPYFIGRENSCYGIEAATIGVEQNVPWIKNCLNYYNGRHFILENGEYDIKVLPSIIADVLTSDFIIKDIENVDSWNLNDNGSIYRFSVDFFSPKTWNTGEIQTTQNTYSIHHFSGSWKPKYQLFEKRFWNYFGIKDLMIIGRIEFKILEIYKWIRKING